MAQYFFNLDDGESHGDSSAIDLPDAEAAKQHAAHILGERLIASPSAFWGADEWRVDVTNASGLLLFTIHCTGVIAPAGR